MTNPITSPPPELVRQWEEQFLERPTINGCFIQSYIAAKAAQWGADQELESCCTWLDRNNQWAKVDIDELRAARRPNVRCPSSLTHTPHPPHPLTPPPLTSPTQHAL